MEFVEQFAREYKTFDDFFPNAPFNNHKERTVRKYLLLFLLLVLFSFRLFPQPFSNISLLFFGLCFFFHFFTTYFAYSHLIEPKLYLVSAWLIKTHFQYITSGLLRWRLKRATILSLEDSAVSLAKTTYGLTADY